MPFKLDVDRLTKEELVWELKIRGIAESDNVDSLRKSLRSALSVEKDASFIQTFDVENVEEECNICETKLTDINNILKEFTGSTSQVRKLETKICHTFNRLEHVKSDETLIKEKRANLLKGLMESIETYNAKVRTLRQVEQVQVPTDPRLFTRPGISENATQQVPLSSSPQSQMNDSFVDPNISNSSIGTTCKSVPVYKWQLKFSGQPSESFNAFLEEVEEHCQSRNVDKVQLFASARDLFTGDALRMYNWFKKHVSDWNGLVRLMKEEYVPSAEKLWQQILTRTQGGTESIGLYVAVMTGLFDRMPTPVAESLRMQVLRRNILPFFQERLALTEISTPLELIELCRRIEETRESVDRFKPPNLSSLSLEPDLAYAGSSRRSRPSLAEVQVQEPVCWRCRTPGHVVKDCPTKKNDFRCFGCGREGFVKSNCPSCNKNTRFNRNQLNQGNSGADSGNRNNRGEARNPINVNRGRNSSGNGSQRQ